MTGIELDNTPSKKEMVNWTKTIFKQGIRLPGYPADYWAENWVKEQFENFGLQDITLDPVKVKKWEAKDARLEIWLVENPNEKINIPCFPIPYSKPTDGVEADLTPISNEEQLSEKIAVTDITLFNIPVKMLRFLTSSDRVYDPMNEFETLYQLVPFDIRFQNILESAIEKGAKALIGILSGFPWDTDKYYVPYDAVERSIPGIYVSPENGRKISDLIEKGVLRARIAYKGKISEITTHNITGTLPGMSDEWIIIGTHHDGPWNSAVEDASGMALVLAQVKYWSQLTREERPFNMMFLMNCAHMAGGMGAEIFAERNNDFLKKVVLGIHLEHVARDVISREGKLIPLDDPTVRWWFVSRILPLEEITENAILKEDLQRSIFLPPDGIVPGMDKPPTDGSFYQTTGVPFVSFLTAPPYLFDPSDTMDMIHEESFEPLTRAVIRIIYGLKGYTAEELRSQILTKRERKKIRKKQLKKM